MKNILKRATALMLSLLMVFSVCSTSLIIYAQSEAESSDEELIYVSLGDSTTNGYGLTGYEFTQDDAFAAMVSQLNSDYPDYNGERTFENPNGLLMETPGAYPALFKNYLQIVNPSKDVNLIQLATSAMRADDVLTLMTVGTDEYFDLDDYSGNKNNDKYVIHNYSDVANELPFDWEFDLDDTMGSMGALYQKSVKAADVISINLGSNNFSIYMWGCLGPMIMGMMGSSDSDPDYVPMMDELLATVENESLRAFTKKVANDIKGILVGKLAGAVEGETLQTAVNNLADYGAYTFLSYCITYTKLLNRINDLNDKADIILIPPVNFMKGFTVDVNGKLVDMSEYITYVLQAANIYVSTMAGMKDAEFTNDIYWADHGGMVDMLMAEMVELEATNFEGAEVLHSRLISSLIGWVATLSGGAFDLNSAGTVTREAVAAYKTGDINYFMTNYGTDLTAMVYYIAYVGAYVGMEKALITASQKPAVDVNLFLDIVGGTFSSKVSGVFGEVGTTVGGNAEQGGAALGANNTDEGFATLLGIGDAVAEILTRTVNAEGEKDETAQGMLYVMAYFMVADGVVCHPSEKGYQTVYATMVNAYTKGITPDAGSNGYLGEDVPAIKEIYRYLTNSGYMSDDQAVAIVDYIYDKYMDDMALSAEEKTDIAKFIYDTLITNSDLSDSAKTDIIANVYTILRNNNFLTDYEKDLAIVEELCVALDPYVTDAQAMQIVNYIYEAIQLNNVDKVAIAKYIYSVLIKDNDPEKATAIIEVVYSVLKKNGYLKDYADQTALIEAILAIPALAKVSDATAIAITDYLYGQLTAGKEIDVMNIANYIIDLVFYKEGLEPADKIEILVGVYTVFENANYFVGYENVLNAAKQIISDPLFDKVKDDQTWAIIDKIYTFATDDTGLTEDEIRYLAYFIYSVVLNGTNPENAIPFNGRRGGVTPEEIYYSFTASEKLAIIDAVYESLQDNGLVDTSTPEMAAFDNLYKDLVANPENADTLLSEEDTIAILENVITSVGTAPEITDEVIIKVAQDSVNILLESEDMSTEDLLTLVEKISGAITNSGLGGEGTGNLVPSAPDLGIAKELVNALTADGLLTDAQAKKIIQELMKELLSGAPFSDPTAFVDALYEIVYEEGFDIVKTVKIVIVVTTFAYENELIQNAANPYYAQAMAAVLTEENKANAISSIGSAKAAINSAIVALGGKARANMGDTTALKAALRAELEATWNTLDEIESVLNNLDQLKVKDEYQIQATIAVLLKFEDDLYTHARNIAKIATEAGIFAMPYIQYALETINHYAGVAAGVAQDAYNWCVANVQGFVADYYALANEMKALASKIDPALGEAVYDFMIEVPSDTIKILYLYGEGAVDKLILDAVAAGEDIYDAVAALAHVLQIYGKDIYDAVKEDKTGECKILVDRIEQIMGELEGIANELNNAPAATVNAYKNRIDELTKQLGILYGEFFDAAMAAIDAANPAARLALQDAVDTLVTVLNTVGGASGAYGEFFVAHAAEMGGEILKAFVENWNEFAGDAAPIFIAIGHSIEKQVEEVIGEVSEYIEAQLKQLEAILKDLEEKVGTAAGELEAQIREQIRVINEMIAELRQILDDGLAESLRRAGELIIEIKNETIKLAKALYGTAYDEATKALQAIADKFVELDKIVTEIVGEYYENLKTELGEFTTKVFADLINYAIGLLPELDAALYDYFYNNPEEVIAFFNEYGDEIAAFLEEYGVEALGVIAVALAIYGRPLAEYIINNPEAVLAGLNAWADKYGDRVAAILQVYADALGICEPVQEEIDALREELIELNEKLNKLNAQLQTAVGEAREAILAEIAKVQAEIARVQAKIAELQAKLQALVDAISGLDEALKKFANEAVATATAAVTEAIANLQKAISDLMDSVSNEVAAKLREILNRAETLTKELIADLAKLAVEAVIKFAPELDAYLYDYFYNNPDEVIAFFNEYGKDIIDLCEKYGDKALAVVAIALAYFGPDLANYIVNNPEAVLAGLSAWADKYGDRIIAIMQVYAEALGLCDAVREEIAELEAKRDALVAQLKALNAQLQNAVGEAKKAIEAEIAKVQAELARVQAKLDELNAKLQALVNAIYQLDDALKQFVTESIENATAAVIAAIDNLNKAVKDLLGSVSDDVAAKLEQLIKTGVGLTKELIADLAKLAVEAVIKFAPELDAYLYDYFYNNPEEVIAFFNEYGDEIIELCKEHGDKALAVVVIALAYYGPELAEYIINNPEDVLAGICAWADKYGERVVAILQVYAEALGLCDAVREDINELNAQLAALQAELMKQLNILQNELQAELNELYAQLKDAADAQKVIILEKIKEIESKIELVQQYIAELQAKIAELQAMIAELNAKLQALINAIYNLDDALKTLINVGIEAGIAGVQSALNAVAVAIRDLIGVVSDDIASQIDQLLAKAKDYLNNAYNSAIIADYVIDNMSNYVALGDNKVYADLFAQYLINEVAKADVGYTYKVNTALVQNGSKINTLPVIINTNLNAIAGADLISIGYSFDKIAENTMLMAIELLMDGKTSLPTDFNWVALLGDEAGAEVEKLVADIYATMLTEGLGISVAETTNGLFTSDLLIADVAITAVEYFVYSAVEYATYLPQAVGMINQINPDAIIMINAISNPISGAKISFFGQELVFGDYLDYVCDAIYVETAVLAVMYENVVFVPTTEVETTLTDYTISMNSSQDLMAIAQLFAALMENQAINTTPNGNAYVCEKMADALNITVKDSVLLGDVNGDGYVTIDDVVCYRRYLAELIAANEINLAAADVTGEGKCDIDDVVQMRRYLAELITAFPAEEKN